mmetsp:Transcript_7953/g.23969  ORF Transcript_7953/g.23969 Transcript_7953/m.23969 type:complete len:246 (-) Transcript_7953:195-932(-)
MVQVMPSGRRRDEGGAAARQQVLRQEVRVALQVGGEADGKLRHVARCLERKVADRDQAPARHLHLLEVRLALQQLLRHRLVERGLDAHAREDLAEHGAGLAGARKDARCRHPDTQLAGGGVWAVVVVRPEEASALCLRSLALDKGRLQSRLAKDVRVRLAHVRNGVVALEQPLERGWTSLLQFAENLASGPQIAIVLCLGARAAGEEAPGRRARKPAGDDVPHNVRRVIPPGWGVLHLTVGGMGH